MCFWASWIRVLPRTNMKIYEYLYFLCEITLLIDFLSFKTDLNGYLYKVISIQIRKKLPPDPALFVSDFQDANKKCHGFGTLTLTGCIFIEAFRLA
jgi:hypothetical protein